MKHIGLLSDTHSYLDKKIFEHFSACDEIWHAGDFGNEPVSKELSAFKPLRGVYGNIDGNDIRIQFPLHLFFLCEEIKVLIIHIGGTPSYYQPEAKRLIEEHKPDLFICGHSHILKVMKDKKNNLLYMNPGAAGKSGFHKVRTVLRFTTNVKKIENLDVIELGLRSAID